MKLEIRKEEKAFEKPWYRLMKDGMYITGSYELERVMQLYENYKKDPTWDISRETILISEEINVDLQETNQ